VKRIAASLLVVAFLASCGGARRAETKDPNLVVVAWIAGPDGLNPVTSISSASTMIEHLIYAPLIDLGPDMLPRWSTSLARKVDITDGGTRYVLHLRDARWSDGTALDAGDVVFTIRLMINPNVIAGSTSDFTLMRSIRAVDAHTVEIRLRAPSPPFLLNALANDTYPQPKHVLGTFSPDSKAEADFVNTDASYNQNPLVSGPFRIERIVSDAYLVLSRNPTYWGPPSILPEIAFRVYPQQDSLYAAVDAGEVDVTDVPPNLWRVRNRLRGDHRFINWPWSVTFYLLPNFHDPTISFIKERAVRQAMLVAINRKFITTGIMSGQADILNGPLPSFSPYYDPRVPKYDYDPAKARAMLESAGWHLRGGVRTKNGVALRITLTTGGATDAIASNIAELIQENLRAVGIDCILQNEELQTFFDDVHHSRFQLALRGRILGPYPDDYQTFQTQQTRENGGYNLGYYSNPQIDRAIEDARTAISPARARAALDRYQELAAVDVPAIFLYSNRLGAVVPADLEGLGLTPLSPAALPMDLQFWHRTSAKPGAATR
jgi:peptide/nickel transport system substrate-binding protein